MTSRYFDEFRAGEVFRTRGRTVTESDVVTFAGLSGDFTPIHMDEEYCRTTPFGTRIAHGLLGTSIASGLITQLGLLEETAIALLEMAVKFTGPVKLGDTVHAEIAVEEARATSKPDRGIVIFGYQLKNQRGETVQSGRQTVMVRRRT